jgi:hypothetical protein
MQTSGCGVIISRNGTSIISCRINNHKKISSLKYSMMLYDASGILAISNTAFSSTAFYLACCDSRKISEPKPVNHSANRSTHGRIDIFAPPFAPGVPPKLPWLSPLYALVPTTRWIPLLNNSRRSVVTMATPIDWQVINSIPVQLVREGICGRGIWSLTLPSSVPWQLVLFSTAFDIMTHNYFCTPLSCLRHCMGASYCKNILPGETEFR